MADAERQQLEQAVALLLKRGNELFTCLPAPKKAQEQDKSSSPIQNEVCQDDLMNDDDFFELVEP